MAECIDPKTGAAPQRGMRPLTLTYLAHNITVDMPGSYGALPDEGAFDAEDMKVSDRALNQLKCRAHAPFPHVLNHANQTHRCRSSK